MFRFFDDSKRIEGNESEDVAHLALVEDRVSEQLLCGILEDNGIPFMRKERSRGIATSVIAGVAVFGVDIYVRRDMLEQAKELYEAYLCTSLDESLCETDNEEE